MKSIEIEAHYMRPRIETICIEGEIKILVPLAPNAWRRLTT